MKHQSYWSGDCPRYEHECGFRVEVADRKDLPEKCPECGMKLFVYFTEADVEFTDKDYERIFKSMKGRKR